MCAVRYVALLVSGPGVASPRVRDLSVAAVAHHTERCKTCCSLAVLHSILATPVRLRLTTLPHAPLCVPPRGRCQ